MSILSAIRPFAVCSVKPYSVRHIDQNWSMRIEEVLAKNLDALMRAHGEFTSQQRLAAATGIGQTSVGRMRRGEGSATIDNLAKVAKAFHRRPGDLLDPRLASSLKGSGVIDGRRERAAILAAQIEESDLTDAQLQILENTLAALRLGS